MTWQKCPICEGSGILLDSLNPLGRKCDLCKGMYVISTLTGKPPINELTNRIKNTSIGIRDKMNNYKEPHFTDEIVTQTLSNFK